MVDIAVLVYNNTFSSLYDVFPFFFQEILETFRLLNIKTYSVKNVEQAIYVMQNFKVDFSIGLGIFDFYYNNIPVYDIFKIPHYQWIFDNPLKVNIDFNSLNVKYVFIDYEFPKVIGNLKKKYIVIPLGYFPSKYSKFRTDKINAVLFPGQVRNLKDIIKKIDVSEYKNEIYDFINNYNYDDSYISELCKKTKNCSPEKKKELFYLTNSFIRTHKRIKIIESIKLVPVYVLDEQTDNEINSANVHFIGRCPYSQLEETMSNYKYILNIDPNFHACIHDRVFRGINAGSIVFSNYNYCINANKKFPYVYYFGGESTVDDLIDSYATKLFEVYEAQKEFIAPFSWFEGITKIVNDFKFS